MTFFPIEKPCDKCGNDFLTAIPGQTTCMTCLSKPSRKNIIVPEKTIKPEGESMPIIVEDKICVDCKKPYKPTSNVQKRCPPCGKIYKAEYQKKYIISEHTTKSTEPKLTKKNAPELSSNSDDAMILRMLVAAGLVTDEKIQQAREIIMKLKA